MRIIPEIKYEWNDGLVTDIKAHQIGHIIEGVDRHNNTHIFPITINHYLVAGILSLRCTTNDNISIVKWRYTGDKMPDKEILKVTNGDNIRMCPYCKSGVTRVNRIKQWCMDMWSFFVRNC